MQRSRTCLLLIGALAAVLALPASPALAATVPNTPQPTWQTVGALDAQGDNVRGRVNDVVYGHGKSAGRVFIGGEFTRVKPPRGTSGPSIARLHLAALTAKHGALIKKWRVPVRQGASGANARIVAMTLSANGQVLYVGGRFTSVGGKHRLNVAALNAVTGKVMPWHPRPNRGVHAILFDGRNGRIYLGGTFSAVNGVARMRLAAVTAGTGALVPSWHPTVKQATDTCPPRCAVDVHSLVLSPNGGLVYVGGSFAQVNGAGRNSAAAVTAATGHLKAWNPDVFVASHPGALNIVYDLDVVGKRIYLCGDFWQVNAGRASSTVSPNLAAVDRRHGNVMTSFNASTDGSVNACAYHPKARLLFLGGHFDHVGTRAAVQANTASTRHHLAAVMPSGALIAWAPTANSRPGTFAVAVRKTHVGFGGEFTTVNGVPQAGFAQFRIGGL